MRVNGEMIERMAKNTELREKGSVEVTVVEMSRKRLDRYQISTFLLG
jgi:hypothetical protein